MRTLPCSDRLRGIRTAVAVGTAFSLLPLGVSAAHAEASGSVAPPAPATRLSWGQCPSGWGATRDQIDPSDPLHRVGISCATAKVPLDYDQAAGTQVQLAMRRIEATDRAHRLGTLFVNPGGPGGSGVDFVDDAWSLFSPEVRARFDIVGFDPRGIARSDGLSCFSSFQQAAEVVGTTEAFPVNRRQDQQINRTNSTISKLCRKNGGPIADHLSTANVARDLDLLRQEVGDSKLNYAGYSYGTQIGSTYAAMFPQNVRTMIVDGVLDPVAWTTGRRGEGTTVPSTTRLGSDTGSQDTLEQFFSLCRQAGAAACPLMKQGDPAAVYRKVADLAKKEPIRVDSGGGDVTELTYQTLINLTESSLYDASGWSGLAQVVSMAAAQTGVAPLPAGARVSSTAKRLLSGAPMPTIGEGAWGVICEDATNPRDPQAWWDSGRRRDKRSYFGSAWAYSSQVCSSWHNRDADRYPGPFQAATAAPALVIGNLHDPATPYPGAEAVAANLKGSRLLTLAGWGHTSAGLSRCVDGYVSAYLTTGALPAAGTTCRPDHLPFTTDAQIVAGQPTAAGRAQAAARLRARHFVAGLAPSTRRVTPSR